jgi:hypothetical protein
MDGEPKWILEAFALAVIALLEDRDLVRADPAEITLTTDLAMRMVKYFPDYRVSPEWTRREEEEKRIAWDDGDGRRKLKIARPDIIVHIPHRQDKNLLVVEAKRSRNNDYADDIRKLTLMTLAHGVDPLFHYGYQVGVHLIVDIPQGKIRASNAYRNGDIDDDLTNWLGDRLGV